MKKFIVILCVAMSGCTATPSRDEDLNEALIRMLAFQAPISELTPAQLAEVERHPLGSAGNPVLAEGPPGQRAYLMRLRCPDGKPPKFERGGSVTQPSPYGSIMDIYEVACEAPPIRHIYLDMYHRGHVELRAVPGFTIEPPRS